MEEQLNEIRDLLQEVPSDVNILHSYVRELSHEVDKLQHNQRQIAEGVNRLLDKAGAMRITIRY